MALQKLVNQGILPLQVFILLVNLRLGLKEALYFSVLFLHRLSDLLNFGLLSFDWVSQVVDDLEHEDVLFCPRLCHH